VAVGPAVVSLRDERSADPYRQLFNSEIWAPSPTALGIVFARVDGLPRHPVQLYEAVGYAMIFFALLAVYKKTYNKPIRGLIFGLDIALIFLVRFILEYFKIEQAAYSSDLPFTTGQLLSVPFIVAALARFLVSENYRQCGCVIVYNCTLLMSGAFPVLCLEKVHARNNRLNTR